MKRLILSILAVFAIAAVVGCSSSNTAGPTPTPTPTFTPTPTVAPTLMPTLTPTSTLVPTPTPTPSDNTALQGRWTTTTGNMTVTYTFSGDSWSMVASSALTLHLVTQLAGTFTLSSAANPKTIDMLVSSSPSSPGMAGTTLLGIYQLSGTNLTLSVGYSGDRPTSFTNESRLDLVKQ